MGSNRTKGLNWERNERKTALFARNYGKNLNIDEIKALKATEIAKLAESAVKTAKMGQKLREKEERDYLKYYGRPKNGPVSTPNPNLVFKQQKRYNTTNTKYIEQLDRQKEWFMK